MQGDRDGHARDGRATQARLAEVTEMDTHDLDARQELLRLAAPRRAAYTIVLMFLVMVAGDVLALALRDRTRPSLELLICMAGIVTLVVGSLVLSARAAYRWALTVEDPVAGLRRFCELEAGKAKRGIVGNMVVLAVLAGVVAFTRVRLGAVPLALVVGGDMIYRLRRRARRMG